jgi:hypothetical protein
MADKTGWTKPLDLERNALGFVRRWDACPGPGRVRGGAQDAGMSLVARARRLHVDETTMTDGTWRVNAVAARAAGRCVSRRRRRPAAAAIGVELMREVAGAVHDQAGNAAKP